MTKQTAIYSIGHSNRPFEHFLSLLRKYQIDVVVDVRSYPISRFAKQYDTDAMKSSLKQAGVQYIFMGKELGGMPKGQHFYDEKGKLLYDKVAATPEFKSGMERLLTGVQKYNIALVCGEENPAGCHRRKLLAPHLRGHQIEVTHIRGDGTVQTEEDLLKLEQPDELPEQLNIFKLQ